MYYLDKWKLILRWTAKWEKEIKWESYVGTLFCSIWNVKRRVCASRGSGKKLREKRRGSWRTDGRRPAWAPSQGRRESRGSRRWVGRKVPGRVSDTERMLQVFAAAASPLAPSPRRPFPFLRTGQVISASSFPCILRLIPTLPFSPLLPIPQRCLLWPLAKQFPQPAVCVSRSVPLVFFRTLITICSRIFGF